VPPQVGKLRVRWLLCRGEEDDGSLPKHAQQRWGEFYDPPVTHSAAALAALLDCYTEDKGAAGGRRPSPPLLDGESGCRVFDRVARSVLHVRLELVYIGGIS
jgi:hypothetical protein